MIEPIVSQDFGNTFHHKNVPNKRQQTHKKAAKKTSQILLNDKDIVNSVPEKYCLGFGLNNKDMR